MCASLCIGRHGIPHSAVYMISLNLLHTGHTVTEAVKGAEEMIIMAALVKGLCKKRPDLPLQAQKPLEVPLRSAEHALKLGKLRS